MQIRAVQEGSKRRGHLAASILITLLLVASSMINPLSEKANANTLTTVTAADAVNILLAGQSELTLVAGSVSSAGTIRTFSSVTFSGGRTITSAGVYLDSASGVGNVPPQVSLQSVLTAAGKSSPITKTSYITFRVRAATAGTTSIGLNSIFVSRESFSGGQDWDFGAVMVAGVNYAYFGGNTQRIMRVNSDANTYAGLAFMNAVSGFYNTNATSVLTMNGIFSCSPTCANTATEHEITIAVSDTGDTQVPSGLLVARITGGTATTGGASLSPVNTVAPTISGTATIGSTLTASTGTWSNNPTSYTYQWKSSSDGSTYSNIAGATSSTFLVTQAEGGKFLKVSVVGANVSGAGGAVLSAATTQIPSPPVNTVSPSTPTTPETVDSAAAIFTSTDGTWTSTGPSISFSYQWESSANSATFAGGTWANIEGATTKNYILGVNAVADRYLRFKVTATNAGGSTIAFSAPVITQIMDTAALPNLIVVDPRASSVFLPSIIISGPTNLLICVNQSNSAGTVSGNNLSADSFTKGATDISGSGAATIAGDRSTALRISNTTANSLTSFNSANGLNVYLAATFNTSFYISIRTVALLTASTGVSAATCDGAKSNNRKTVEIRPLGVTLIMHKAAVGVKSANP